MAVYISLSTCVFYAVLLSRVLHWYLSSIAGERLLGRQVCHDSDYTDFAAVELVEM